ncbi:hypothetical protein CKAH01_07681 [Colletotrichum kahawae]|uniref:Nephrocystin 3-like N-terminal domain-containing protein n=1 Tax=Colletotrichum kahawae TaxID=34407 RepID=A0AAD9Y5W2_COLKA|nr:hypothetical protein CKAH01_07681 [Colletotrichum kahawae]
MALALRNAAPLKAQVRLAQAVSEFEASLDGEHKAAFRNARIATRATPPTPSDVMKLTAEIDSRVRQEQGPSRCFGPRLTNILQAVQQFAALGDTVVGGSQNLVACGVWSAVRMVLHMAIGYASYLEKLSLLFMTAGRQAPRYQALAIIYPRSKTLQRYLSEYFIVIVRICQKIKNYAMKSAFSQFKSSLGDADLKEFQGDLEVWGNAIKDEATLLLNQRLQNESQENQRARALVSKWSTSSARQQALERKTRWLDACSTYDFQTAWKQIRKRGSTSLLSTWAEYQLWKHEIETPSAILFNGKIGSGKSVTLANIVDDLYLIGDIVVVYFFCRHDIPESLKSRTILGSLARQYLSHFPENNDVFKRDVTTPDLEELMALMEPKRDGRSRHLLIDGLDECSIEERRSVLTQISWLQKQSNWRIGFSARLSAESSVQQHITLKWRVSLPASNPDIERYIDSELEARLANGHLKLGDPNLVSEIRAALMNGANGMFLWVTLQLDQICSEASDHSIRLAIKSLPRDLSETYARILSNSAAGDTHQYHVRLFKFLAAAYVPLTVGQIQEIASVTVGDTAWDPSKRINDIARVMRFCGSLIMVEEEEQTVQFVHHSARSFCQGILGGADHWQFCFSDEEAHCEMGETAVTYLSYGIFDARLSTHVIPKVDVGGVSERIMENTLGKSKAIMRMALGYAGPKQGCDRDIGPFLATQRGTTSTAFEKISHPFLLYAEKFWILHTRSVGNSAVYKLWERLFDEVDIHDLQLTPHMLGPLDKFEIPCEHPLASAFLWAINYSHLAVFDRLMDLGGKYPFSKRLPWARFRFFRSLLSDLQPQDSFTKAPRLELHMIGRLLPLAITLRLHHTVEWMLPFVDPKEILRVFKVAVSCGNYASAVIVSRNAAFRYLGRSVLPIELLTTAIASHDARMISLLVHMGVARSTNTNALALSSVLYSDIHQAPLLRIILMLAKSGISLNFLSQRDISAIFRALATSPEINSEMASQAMKRILVSNSNLLGVYQRTLQQACAIGSFELAQAACLSYFDCKSRGFDAGKISEYPFEGDELAPSSTDNL